MNFEITDLGHDIKLYRSKSDKKFRVLLASCFHGDESRCLEVIFHYMLKEPSDISFTFIPIVNIFGFKMSRRENEHNENINCTFNHPKCKTGEKETVQSKVILSHLDLIKDCARDGYASLHEDKNSKEAYSHIWVQSGSPSDKIVEDLKVFDFCCCYNTLEDYLYHEEIPITACIEFSLFDNSRERFRFVEKFLNFVRRKDYESNILF